MFNPNQKKFNLIYRGFVVWNDDPAVRGRLKIFVPGVYSDVYSNKPELLPWATPAMSTFGGNSINPNVEIDKLLNKETGWSSTPHAGNAEIGAQVFVFFENGDINFPVFFAFAQSGEGWLSEHPNQHVFKSDNVRIRIDENVKDERSTCKFDSYNSKNSLLSKTNLERDCIKHGWKYDREKGNIKQLETRIDIEVLAENLNAINLNIHGNVNMKLDGNWFVEHVGNKYVYHEGDTYIKQKGSTYIEQEGTVRTKLTGDESKEHIGNYFLTHNGDTQKTHTGTYFRSVDGDVTLICNSEYRLTVGKNYEELIKMSRTSDILENHSISVGGNYKNLVGGNILISAEGSCDTLIGESIQNISYRGNITLETKGDFELTKDGQITPKGFNNIGTKGNIQVISTFGNINIECKKDDSKAQFNKKHVIIPWNPGFVAEMEKIATMYPAFNKYSAIQAAEGFPTENFSIDTFIEIFKSLGSLFIFDGLPVLLPTRMIVQNPNIPIPKSPDDLSWIPNFRTEAKDWKHISTSDYWKLPGRMMGNINIETWSGDINVKTNSSLGCAGNINIEATESGGTLPGYKIGSVNIKNSGKNRIYPDPRDLFLDSNFTSRMSGQLELFTHGTNLTDDFRRSVLPTVADSLLKQFTGFSFNWKATNYNDFYKLNSASILTRGGLGAMTPQMLSKMEKMMEKPGPTLGCPKCISDYLLGLPGVQDICYTTENLEDFGSVGLHSYGFFKFNPFDNKNNPRGTFNILSLDYDKISMGDGHAIDMGFIDREFVGQNIGAFNINTSGSFSQLIGRNYNMKINASYEKGTSTISYKYTEKYYDDVWPSVLKTTFDGINALWNASFGLLAKLDDGVITLLNFFKINTGFRFLDFPLPENKFYIIGEVTQKEEQIGSNIYELKKTGDSYDIDFGFNFAKTKEYVMDPSKLENLKISFKDHEFIIHKENEAKSVHNVVETKRDFCLALKSPFDLTIDVWDLYSYSDKMEQNNDVISGSNGWHLEWNINKPQLFPDYYFKTEDNEKIVRGRGFNESRQFISYRHHFMEDGETVADIIPNFNKAKEEYTDYTKIDKVNVVNSDRGDAEGKYNNVYIINSIEAANDIIFDVDKHAGNDINVSSNRSAGRNIEVSILDVAGRSNKETITWEAPLNTKILNLISKGVFVDIFNGKDNIVERAANNITVSLIGNKDYVNNSHKQEKFNVITYEAIGFPVNNMFVNNGITIDDENDTSDTYKSHGSRNKIEFNNGFNSESCINEYYFINGSNSHGSTNNIKFENGILTGKKENKVNNNRFLINNGNGGWEGTTSTFDMYNGNANTSVKYYAKFVKDQSSEGKPDLWEADITQYSLLSKHVNIGVFEIVNIGSDQTINVGKTRILNVGETQTTTIGLTNTINVPTYVFNTIDMTMNNVNSTTTNTKTYALNCETDTIICQKAYSLTAGTTITETAITSFSINAGVNFTALSAANTTVGAGGSVTVASVGPATLGAAKKEVPTTITGNFQANGHLVGDATNSTCHHNTGAPGPGQDGTSPSAPSIPSLSPLNIENPVEPPEVLTPKTPLTFTNVLVTYFGYLISEFSYLLNIFKSEEDE